MSNTIKTRETERERDREKEQERERYAYLVRHDRIGDARSLVEDRVDRVLHLGEVAHGRGARADACVLTRARKAVR